MALEPKANYRIVIADDKWGRQLGVRFGTQSAFNTNNYNVGVSGTGRVRLTRGRSR